MKTWFLSIFKNQNNQDFNKFIIKGKYGKLSMLGELLYRQSIL